MASSTLSSQMFILTSLFHIDLLLWARLLFFNFPRGKFIVDVYGPVKGSAWIWSFQALLSSFLSGSTNTNTKQIDPSLLQTGPSDISFINKKCAQRQE